MCVYIYSVCSVYVVCGHIIYGSPVIWGWRIRVWTMGKVIWSPMITVIFSNVLSSTRNITMVRRMWQNGMIVPIHWETISVLVIALFKGR